MKLDIKVLYIFSGLTLVLIFPLFPTVFGGKSVHVIPVALIFALLPIAMGWVKKSVFNEARSAAYIFTIILFLMLISLFQDASSGSATLFSLTSVVKPIYWFLFFCLGLSLKIEDKKLFFSLYLFLSVAAVLNFTISIVEVFNPNQLVFQLYKREERSILLDKATGWFGITYFFAYINLITSFYFLFLYGSSKRIIHFFLFAMCISALFLTQSRTMIIALMVGFLLLPFFKFTSKAKIIYVMYFIAIFIAFFLIVFNLSFIIDNFNYAYNGILLLLESGVDLSGGGSGSANVRINQFIWALENNDNIFIGAGLASLATEPLESIYANYYYQMGAPFLFFCIYFFVYLHRLMSKVCLNCSNDKFEFAFSAAFSVIAILSPIAFMSSPLHENPKIALICFFSLGVCFRLKKNRN